MKKIIKCEDIEFQIYIEDTDFQGVVYHSNYLKYFERSRSEFLSYANISQNKLREKDLAFIVKSIKICLLYTSPSPRDDELSRMPSSA